MLATSRPARSYSNRVTFPSGSRVATTFPAASYSCEKARPSGSSCRVGLARALALDPQILLFDEPTSGLDPVTGAAIDELVIRMRDELGVTSVVVSHDIASITRVADRIAMLYKGKIIAIGAPKDIKNTKDPIVKQFITGAAKGPITEDA